MFSDSILIYLNWPSPNYLQESEDEQLLLSTTSLLDGLLRRGERIETSRINIERSWALGATGVLIVGHEGVGLPLGGDPFGETRGHCLIDILGHHVVSKLPAFLHENKSTSMKWRLACMLLTCVP